MASTRDFSRYSLYGEDNGTIAPEFLHIEPISTRSRKYEWTIAAHTHPGIFQILLLEQGSGVLTADNRVIALAPQALVAIPSGAIHAFAFAQDAEGWVLSIASALAAELGLHHGKAAPALANRSHAVSRNALPDRLARRIAWLLGEMAADYGESGAGRLPDSSLASLTLLLTLCGEALADVDSPRLKPTGTAARREQLVQRFRALVESHFREGWAVARYAAVLGTSPPSLSRACQAALGRSPAELVLDRIQLEAMRALTYSAASVQAIAHDLGFEDPAYFARFFKRRTGMTASQFRHDRAWLSG